MSTYNITVLPGDGVGPEVVAEAMKVLLALEEPHPNLRFVFSEHPVGAVLLNMAVFGAVISYGLQMLSFLLLRRRFPDVERPYRSPLGNAGAAVALAISVLTLFALFAADPVYRKVVVGAAAWYALGLVWFALWGRHRLVLSPEEAFAMRGAGTSRPPPGASPPGE